ncbi:acyl-CoA thioesterase [Litorihabitans aurantiacus]|uniref:Thioesterase n=1 Tax=Litorihabitans aurantiacus TaxID=1930061 RepID=A0AA38CRH8_9MICO|nr:thioesterase family protein [Litorihabitans aurantiacus]GMA31916.1 thioesterase [Litorihabitans aurantiacus]
MSVGAPAGGEVRLRIPVAVRWGDLDAYGHVNNADAFRLLEEARIEAFWAHEGRQDPWPTALAAMGPGAPIQTLVARQEMEYSRPMPHARAGLLVQLWIGRLGGSSIEVCYSIHDLVPGLARTGPPLTSPAYAVAATTLVMVDAATGAPIRLRPEHRAALAPFTGTPVAFRHRR